MPGAVDHAVRQFSRLPGVGKRTAQRFVYELLRKDPEQIDSLIKALQTVVDNVKPCSVCSRLTEQDPCDICSDARRDGTTVCIVAESSDLEVIEASARFRGKYHVLGGLLNPSAGVGPEKLTLAKLADRVKSEGITEVIVALSASVEGDTTSLYIARQLKPLGVTVTSLARGLPAGGSLDHADKVTVGLSLEGRIEI